MLLAIDPGIRGAGVALFSDVELLAAGYARNSAKQGQGPYECALLAQAVDEWCSQAVPHLCLGSLDALAVEWPQVYTAGKLAGDPNDLLALAGVGASICSRALAWLAQRYPDSDYLRSALRVIYYQPHEWKGQLPKLACARRVQDRLSTLENRRLQSALRPLPVSLQHNVFDAVGIGLKALGRFEPARTLAR